MRVNGGRILVIAAALTMAADAAWAQGKGPVADSPEGGARTYAQNYKDMVLAECISTAYGKETRAAIDAGSSASVLQEWTNYVWDRHPYNPVVTAIVQKYLARDYRNPLVFESEFKDLRFDLLKCLDLYHGKELDDLVKRVVIRPKRSYRLDYPPFDSK